MKKYILLLAAMAFLFSQPAAAEMHIKALIGANSSFDSDVSYKKTDNNINLDSVSWDGHSFEFPPIYSIDIAYFWNENWGVMLDFTHAKIVADSADVKDNFDTLEMTDGNNLVTANIIYNIPLSEGLDLLLGAGIGIAIPHVEVTLADEDPDDPIVGVSSNDQNANIETREYQVTGFAAQLMAELDYEFYENYHLLFRYALSYSDHDADLKDGGRLEFDVITNLFLIGLGYSFSL